MDCVFLLAVGTFFLVFLIYPLAHVFVRAFSVKGRFSLALFGVLFGPGGATTHVVNSLLLGLATTVGTTLVCFPLAFIVVKYAFPLKRHLTALLMVPMIMPPFVGAIGMRRMLERNGSISLLLVKLGVISEPIDLLSLGGGRFWAVVVLQVLHLYPIMYINVVAALGNIDPSLEEAGRSLGDSGFRLFRRVTFPLLLPGYFAGAIIVFIWAFTDLGTPLILNYRKVMAVQIFRQVQTIHDNPMVYALVVVVIALSTLCFAGGRVLVGRRRFDMLSKGTTAARERAAPRRALPFIYAAICGVTALALLPHVGVILTAMAETWSETVLPTDVSGRYFRQAATHPLAAISIPNSLFLSLASTGIDVVLGLGIAYYLVRKRVPAAALLDALAMLPLALPGIVLAFGYVGCFSGTVLDPMRSSPMALLIIAYAVRRLPFMVRAACAGLQQTSRDMEEASLSLGASPGRTVIRITVPLIAANLIAGAILCFSFAMLEVSSSLVLASKQEYFPITRAIFEMQKGVQIGGPAPACAMGVFAMVLLCGTLLAASLLMGKRMGQLFRV